MKIKYKGILLASLMLLTATTGCGVSEEAKSVQSLIDSFPEEFSDVTEEQLNEAMSAYEQLSDDDKEDVDKTRLDDAHSYFIDSVQSVINALPDECADVTMEQLNEAKEAYEQLSDENKTYIDTTKLDNVENYFTELVSEINTKIDELKFSPAKNISESNFEKGYKSIGNIMAKIEKLPPEYDSEIKYDVLKKTIDNLNSDISMLLVDCGNDLTAFQNIQSDIQSLLSMKSGSRYFSSTAYSYCTDISDNMSAIKTVPVTSDFKDALDDVKNKALHDEDMMIFSMGALSREYTTWSGKFTSLYNSQKFLFDETHLNKLKEYSSTIAERQKS
ncbi:MAG: hypothetical protein NC340_09700 [Ruminococcus flavefaciens]|nr:hypothetical protein [Ruminococcus flavefaciens]MCM1230585.1 hypothetical protein [Ruminococcus flavefaciens]